MTGADVEETVLRMDPEISSELGPVCDRVVARLNEDPDLRREAAEALHAWRETFGALAAAAGLADRRDDDPSLVALTLIVLTLWAG
jgi:hypothetical protein